MKLSDREKQILVVMQMRANYPIAKAAKLTGYREHTIRRSLKNLLEQELIHRITYINVYALGYTCYEMYFSLASKMGNRAKVLEYLMEMPRTSFLAEIGGDYEYKIGLCVRGAKDIVQFLDDLFENFGPVLSERDFAEIVSATDFPIKFLGANNIPESALSWGVTEQQVRIDEVDHQVLCKLSNINTGSLRQISRELGIPASNVEYRVNRLKKEGVILGSLYVIDTAKFGMLCYSHLVSLRECGEKVRNRLFLFCQRHPHVYFLMHCCGKWDLEIGTIFQRPEEMRAFKNDFNGEFGNLVQTARSFNFLTINKVSHYPFSIAAAVIT